MQREPWLHFWGPKDAQAGGLIRASLAATGIDASAPSGDGIVCFSDIDQDLFEFLREASHNGGERVLAIAGSAAAVDGSEAWDLLRAGASDVFAWSSAPDLADRIKARFERWNAIDELVQSPRVREKLVGDSPAWRSVLRQIVEVAHFTAASVLLIGESGTGKELIARLIHELDPRAASRQLVVVDCTTIVSELSGSEFFGHERGAFTGAVAARDGAFATADGGMLFLDEVGELPMPLQAQLLRVVQERMYKRVGGNAWNHTEFRLVCATNRNLLAAIESGEFRRDLYHRVASWVFRVPALHQRREDILPLARHFLRSLRPDRPLDFDAQVGEFLLDRPYPGNVRDLRQLVARMGSRHVGPGPLTLGDIPDDERPAAGQAHPDWRNAAFEEPIRCALSVGAGLREISQAAADIAIRIAVEAESGNLQNAARRLGVTDRALQMRRAARRRNVGGR
jgi:transcriptional regulator with GAF, ATPase, and Fis domain